MDEKHNDVRTNEPVRQPDSFDYEEEKTRWISRHGSRRLQLAAERGYKHDGIYRDERAARELPGLVALPKATVGEVVNPSGEAIELETQTMERIAGLTPVHATIVVRIVWVKDSGSDMPDGEYVMVDGYLGKHKLYWPVDDEGGEGS